MKLKRKGLSMFSLGSWSRYVGIYYENPCDISWAKEPKILRFSPDFIMLLTCLEAQRRQHPIRKYSRSRVRIACQQTISRIVRIEDCTSSITTTTATTKSVSVALATRTIITISPK
jgi:hypothetical protein